jgi:hypothetical protein
VPNACRRHNTSGVHLRPVFKVECEAIAVSVNRVDRRFPQIPSETLLERQAVLGGEQHASIGACAESAEDGCELVTASASSTRPGVRLEAW